MSDHPASATSGSWERMCEYIHELLQRHPALEQVRGRPQIHASPTSIWGVLSAPGRRVSTEPIRGAWWDPLKKSRAHQIADEIATDLAQRWDGPTPTPLELTAPHHAP